jgi:hypothetical protein
VTLRLGIAERGVVMIAITKQQEVEEKRYCWQGLFKIKNGARLSV